MSMVTVGVGLGTAAIGAGATLYASNQQTKAQRDMAKELNNFPITEQLQYAKRSGELQLKQNRKQLDMAMEYALPMARTQNAATAELLRRFPTVTQAERTATTAQRAGDAADLNRLGGDFARGLSAMSPAYAALNEQIAGGGQTPLLAQLNEQALYGSPIQQELARQALAELQLGGGLTAEQERMAQQSSRAAFADRGMLYGNTAIGAEILNRDAFSRQREMERRQFASGVDAQQQAFGINVQNLNEANAGNFRNFLLNAGQAQINPILALFGQRSASQPMQYLGMGSTNPSTVSVGQLSTTAPSVAQGVQGLQGLYAYAGDAANTNMQLAMNNANQRANMAGALGGGLMDIGSTALQGYFQNRPTTG